MRLEDYQEIKITGSEERENCQGAFQSPGTACGIAGEGEGFGGTASDGRGCGEDEIH